LEVSKPLFALTIAAATSAITSEVGGVVAQGVYCAFRRLEKKIISNKKVLKVENLLKNTGNTRSFD
jgi:hypothetical protein